MPKADPREVGDVEGGDEDNIRRGGKRPPCLVEIVNADDQRGASAATPGSSLPSSHSRNAPPAVET